MLLVQARASPWRRQGVSGRGIPPGVSEYAWLLCTTLAYSRRPHDMGMSRGKSEGCLRRGRLTLNDRGSHEEASWKTCHCLMQTAAHINGRTKRFSLHFDSILPPTLIVFLLFTDDSPINQLALSAGSKGKTSEYLLLLNWLNIDSYSSFSYGVCERASPSFPGCPQRSD